MKSESIVYDEHELAKAISHTSMAHDIVKAAIDFELLHSPVSIALWFGVVTQLCTRIEALLTSCLVVRNNYEGIETSLPGTILKQGQGGVPALAAAITGVLQKTPFLESGVVATTKEHAISGVSPSNIGDVVSRMGVLQRDAPGTIRIEQVVESEETAHRQFIVYLPGIASPFDPSTSDAFNWESAVAAIAGTGVSSAEIAAGQAMKMAGIGTQSGDEVTFVGYSAGAIVATNLSQNANYKVKGIVSIAGQIGHSKVAKDIKVLNIQHQLDWVAQADLTPKPNNSQFTNIELAPEAVASQHNIGSYIMSAERLVALGDTALEAKLAPLLPKGGSAVTGALYQAQLP